MRLWSKVVKFLLCLGMCLGLKLIVCCLVYFERVSIARVRKLRRRVRRRALTKIVFL